jgi:mRNA-degrading endonuclease toxin of MazEF toxin-antitoxin module
MRIRYAPRRNGRPDPGEVVWAWVPYEDDPSQGKDRPVLVIASDSTRVVALPLTSKDHDADAAQEAHAGRVWMDVGSGPWDRQRRPSEVRLNRVLVLDPRAVRREGGALPKPTFDEVVRAVTPYLLEPGV